MAESKVLTRIYRIYHLLHQRLDELEAIMSAESSYKTYRAELLKSAPPIVPYMYALAGVGIGIAVFANALTMKRQPVTLADALCCSFSYKWYVSRRDDSISRDLGR